MQRRKPVLRPRRTAPHATCRSTMCRRCTESSRIISSGSCARVSHIRSNSGDQQGASSNIAAVAGRLKVECVTTVGRVHRSIDRTTVLGCVCSAGASRWQMAKAEDSGERIAAKHANLADLMSAVRRCYYVAGWGCTRVGPGNRPGTLSSSNLKRISLAHRRKVWSTFVSSKPPIHRRHKVEEDHHCR